MSIEIRLPGREAAAYDQDEEWCEVIVDGEMRRIRFHDYDEIYSIPGLYEQLFYEELECDSPRTVCGLLSDYLSRDGHRPETLRVLEVGAGNGMGGEELRRLGVDRLVGVDIIAEAASAAERDRPGAYDDYLVVDLTGLSDPERELLERQRFNSLVTVAALGFGDIPPDAFATAYNLVSPGGVVAFNIKEDFVSDGDGTGFSGLISRGLDTGAIEQVAERRYRHRLSVAGEPLYYMAIVAEKRADLPLG